MNRLERQIYAITSIFGGWGPTYEASGDGQFLFSFGIDPEAEIGTIIYPNGAIVPTRYTRFSTGEQMGSAPPVWINGSPTSSGVYVVDANGSIITYGATILASSEVGLVRSSTNGAGNGALVYNDYLYVATATDITRLGRLSVTQPLLAKSYWIDDLTQSALVNGDYPLTRSFTYPNHVLHFHNDGRVYVADYDGANGRLHSFTTDSNGANGSATYNDLTLPPGYMPMDMKSYGTDIAIVCSPAAVYSSGAIPRSGKALLALWDSIPGNRPYRYIPIEAQLATALVSRNGELYVLAGNIDTGVKMLRYLGGYSFETVAEVNEGSPPPASAVDSDANMIAWGGHVTYPATKAGAFTLGYRSGRLPGNSLNQIAISTVSDTNPIITALKFLQRTKYPVLGWRGDTSYGLDKNGGSAAFVSSWRSKKVNIGKKFVVRRVTLPLSTPVDANTSITATIYVDNDDASFATTPQVINSTSYPNGEQVIDFQNIFATGFNDFSLQVDFAGTTQNAVLFPINIEYELTD